MRRFWVPASGRMGLCFALVLGPDAQETLHPDPNRLSVTVRHAPSGTLVLPSGLRVIVEQDRTQPFVAVAAVVGAGASDDPPGKEGLAHLVEHLSFRSRGKHAHRMTTLLANGGAGRWNGFISHDLTAFYEMGPPESLKDLLSAEGGRLARPLAGVDGAAFAAERNVVRNELLTRDETGQLLTAAGMLFAALYPAGHPYARPIGGTEQSLAGLQLADAEAFVRQHYRLGNITLVIVGDIDLASLPALVGAALPAALTRVPEGGRLPPPRGTARDAPPVPPLPDRPAVQRIRAAVDTASIYLGWSLPRAFDADARLQAMITHQVQRAAARARSDDVVGVRAWLDKGRFGSTLVCSVRLRDARRAEKAAEAIMDAIFTLRSGMFESPAGETIELISAAEAPDERALLRATRMYYLGEPEAVERELEAIASYPRIQAGYFVNEWITRERARAVVVEPDPSAAPGDADGRETPFAPFDYVPVPVDTAMVRAVADRSVVKARSVTLANGLEVVFVHRETVPLVALTLSLPGGTSTSRPLGAAQLSEGLAKPVKVYNQPWGTGGSISMSLGRDSTYVEMLGGSGTLELLIAGLEDWVTSLHIDDAWRIDWPYIQAARGFIADTPEARFSRSVRQAVYGSSPYSLQATGKDCDAVGLGDVQDWLSRTLQPRGAVLAISGQFDDVAAERSGRRHLEGWRSGEAMRPGPAAELAASSPSPASVRMVVSERPGARQAEIRIACASPAGTPRERVASWMLAVREAAKLDTASRKKLGASYGFSGGARWFRQVTETGFVGRVDVSTLPQILDVARGNIEQLANLSVAPEDLEWLRWRALIDDAVATATTVATARRVAQLRSVGFTMEASAQPSQLILAVTAEDLGRVASACRRTAVIGVLGDPKALAPLPPSSSH